MNAVRPILAASSATCEIDALAQADDPRRAFLRSRWFEAGDGPSPTVTIVRDPTGRPLLALPLTAKKLGLLSVRQVGGAYWPFRGAPPKGHLPVMEWIRVHGGGAPRKGA